MKRQRIIQLAVQTSPVRPRSHRASGSVVFFCNDTATTEIYTLSLHDALPILRRLRLAPGQLSPHCQGQTWAPEDRKSTRLNSSHGSISYAVFCLKKKKNH